MICLTVLLLGFAAALPAADKTFDAVQRKKLRPDVRGALVIGEEEIRFETRGGGRGLRRQYGEIQSLDRLGPTELVIVTYENALPFRGRGKRYRFSLTSGEIDGAMFAGMAERLAKPVSNRAFSIPAEDAAFDAGAKHLHRAGGCQGRLVFSAKAAWFQSADGRHSREWLLDRDIDSVWSAGPYRLDIHARDPGGAYGITRFRFLLKQPLDRQLYRRLKLQLMRLPER